VVNLPPDDGGIAFRTSLILTLDTTVSPRTAASLSAAERRAKQFLADLIVSEGVPLPQTSGFPSPIHGQPLHGVTKERWHKECEARNLSTAEDKKFRNLTFRRVFQQCRAREGAGTRVVRINSRPCVRSVTSVTPINE
jgi:hypothetical protein